MKNNKSAKDLAFDKERAKYRQQINELERKVEKTEIEKLEIENELLKTRQKCSELQDWIDRLLEYTEMSEEDMKKFIEKERQSAEAMERLNSFLSIGKMFSGTYFGRF